MILDRTKKKNEKRDFKQKEEKSTWLYKYKQHTYTYRYISVNHHALKRQEFACFCYLFLLLHTFFSFHRNDCNHICFGCKNVPKYPIVHGVRPNRSLPFTRASHYLPIVHCSFYRLLSLSIAVYVCICVCQC